MMEYLRHGVELFFKKKSIQNMILHVETYTTSKQPNKILAWALGFTNHMSKFRLMHHELKKIRKIKTKTSGTFPPP